MLYYTYLDPDIYNKLLVQSVAIILNVCQCYIIKNYTQKDYSQKFRVFGMRFKSL